MVTLTTTIVGIIVLTVLADMLLPEGQTSKYIKMATSIIVVYVMISGVVGIINYDSTAVAISLDSVTLDEQYIEYVVSSNADAYAEKCVQTLETMGYSGVTVDVQCEHSDYSVNICFVEVNISQCGISWENNNIDIVVQDIVSTLSYILSVESWQVSVCQ